MWHVQDAPCACQHRPVPGQQARVSCPQLTCFKHILLARTVCVALYHLLVLEGLAGKRRWRAIKPHLFVGSISKAAHLSTSCWCSEQVASNFAEKGAGTCACAHLAETVGGKSRLAEGRVLRVMPLARLQSGPGRHPGCYPKVLVGPGLVMRLLWRAWQSPEEAGSHKTWHMAGTCSPLSACALIRVQPCFTSLTHCAAALTGSSCAIQVVWNSSSTLASTRTHCTMDPLPAIAGQEVGSSALGAMGCCCCTRKY